MISTCIILLLLALSVSVSATPPLDDEPSLPRKSSLREAVPPDKERELLWQRPVNWRTRPPASPAPTCATFNNDVGKPKKRVLGAKTTVFSKDKLSESDSTVDGSGRKHGWWLDDWLSKKSKSSKKATSKKSKKSKKTQSKKSKKSKKSSPPPKPTVKPVSRPTVKPISRPTVKPISRPTVNPVSRPTVKPISRPTVKPISRPTVKPTSQPTCPEIPSDEPTSDPTSTPTIAPAALPSSDPTSNPTFTYLPPSYPVGKPTPLPTDMPTAVDTAKPSSDPTSSPMVMRTASPSLDTISGPTSSPMIFPAPLPTSLPTSNPIPLPTEMPTAVDTARPSSDPTSSPIVMRTASPTSDPASRPTSSPTISPTTLPTSYPTFILETIRPSSDPTSSPIVMRTASPSSDPTSRPTVIDATPLPTASPSATPTASRTCPIEDIICDFDTLFPGVALSNETQAQRLLDDCGVSVTAINAKNNYNVVNVFNSSDIKGNKTQFDPDLGSPNQFCPGGGPGIGVGGEPNSTFPNCERLGNLLIIQNEKTPIGQPNDSAFGGCFVFNFINSVALINFGILDIDEGSVNTTITTSDNDLTSFQSPANIGDNGFWKANGTVPLDGFVDVKVMQVCLRGSGSVAFLHFRGCLN